MLISSITSKKVPIQHQKLLGRPQKYYVIGYYNSYFSFSFNIKNSVINYHSKTIDDFIVQMDGICNNHCGWSWNGLYGWEYSYNQSGGVITVFASQHSAPDNAPEGGGWRGDPPKANIFVF